MNEETTFYQEIQTAPGLDERDARGRKRNLPLVLVGLILGMLRNRDGNLSSLHRSMINLHEDLCAALSIDNEPVISRAHLPRILLKINLQVFENLVFKKFGIKLSEDEKRWFAGDGKEMRGSIEKGDKRGEVIVQIVEHESRQAVAQSFYNGTKESEKPCLQELVAEKGLHKIKLTVDALHLYPAFTEPINVNGGLFLAGLKNNQKELMEELQHHMTLTKPIGQSKTVDKGHGRLEIRKYTVYPIQKANIDERWDGSNLQTLIKVEREVEYLKTNELYTEISYYVTNGKPENYEEYFEAVRRHWSIEVNNHSRDVILKEDRLRTKIKSVTRALANCRTLVLEIIRLRKPKNRVALLESFQDKFSCLILALKEVKFL